MSFTKRFVPFVALFAALVSVAPRPAEATGPSQASPAQASKFIEDMGDRCLRLIASYSSSNPIEFQTEFRKIVSESFDLDLIGRFALGPSWQTATADERQEYQKLFAVWMTDSYTRRLGAGGGGWTLSVIGAKPGFNSADAMVETQINRPDGKSITVNLRVRKREDQLRIVDVMMGGVSMAVAQRDEFASVVRHIGLDGLITKLRVGTDDLLVKAGADAN